jgi:flagellar assembly factor FliW
VIRSFEPSDTREKQYISFPRGLFGFEDFHSFVLVESEQSPLYWLQSVEDSILAFPVIDPFLFRPDYEVNVGNEELAEIGISEPKNVLILAVVTIPCGGGPLTANLQGPLIINRETNVGKQVILDGPEWKTKHSILEELEELAAHKC